MKRLILLLFIPIFCYGQDYVNNAETLKLCTTLQTNSFSSNLNADNALDRILEVVGLSKNFVLAPCSDINNAVAVSFKGVRYILYDPNFMSMLSSDTSNWTNLFILAHELGHHVNGHSLDLVLYAGEIVDAPKLRKKREQELEADEFASFVLAKLGASLNQTTSSVSKMSNEDDTYSTHPKRDKRIVAIKRGWSKGVVKKENDKTIKNINDNISSNSLVNSNWGFLQYDRNKLTDDWFERLELAGKNIDPFVLKNKPRFPKYHRVVKAKGYSITDNSEIELTLVGDFSIVYSRPKGQGIKEKSTQWKLFIDGFDETPKVGDSFFNNNELVSKDFEILEKDRLYDAGTGYGKVEIMIDEKYSREFDVYLYGYGYKRYKNAFPFTFIFKGKKYFATDWNEAKSLKDMFGDYDKTIGWGSYLSYPRFYNTNKNEYQFKVNKTEFERNNKQVSYSLKTAEIESVYYKVMEELVNELKKGKTMHLKFKREIEWNYNENGQRQTKKFFIETKTYIFDLKGSSKALSFKP